MKYFIDGNWINDATVTELPDGATALTDSEWETRQSEPYVPSAEEAFANAVTAIKEDAYAQIVELYPEWKQRNMLARVIELNNQSRTRALTVEEEAELDDAQIVWDTIKAIRETSDAAEAAL